ncbi:hypothetical protein ABBQ32_009870 [Trebouxia sp. C0010 RCD-2024]
MGLTNGLLLPQVSIHHTCIQSTKVSHDRLVSSHRLHARRQQHVSQTKARPCCDSRPGASEPSRDPSLPSDVPKAKPPANFNPFRNTKKEDAARAALQDMFKGKDDLLAVHDDAPGGGSGGKGRGKGGGGGGGGGGKGKGGFNFDPSSYWRRFMRLSKGLVSTLGAVLLFAVAISAVSLWQPFLGAISSAFRYVLRLDGPGSRRGPGQQTAQPQLVDSSSELGPSEQSVIGKYGGNDYFAPDSDDDDAE